MEWEQLPNPKLTWEEFKRLKLRRTNKEDFKLLISILLTLLVSKIDFYAFLSF